MSRPDGSTSGQVRGSTARIVPFWVLQAAEILSLMVLADLSLHVSNGGLLVAAGALFAILALVADGPLGVVRICGRKLHVLLVTAASVVVALAPVVPDIRPDVEGIVIVVVVAVGLLRLATLTSTGPGRPRAIAGSGPVIDATASVVGTTPPATSSTSSPSTPRTSPTGAAARWAGRTTAAASSTAAQASARHRPAAEAQLKQAIRKAGRISGKVGKAISQSEPPDPPVS